MTFTLPNVTYGLFRSTKNEVRVALPTPTLLSEESSVAHVVKIAVLFAKAVSKFFAMGF